MSRIEVPGRDIIGIRAGNPGPFSLSGTNSWIVGRNQAWLVDPGPDLDDHVDALAQELERRGGLAGVALTHRHIDHSQAVPAILARFPGAALGAFSVDDAIKLADGDTFGPFAVVHTPGHSSDHVALTVGDVGFTGDTVLGEGSVFIYPEPGALAGYLAALQRLRDRELAILCPGHGPLVTDPRAKLDQYIAHRLDREERLVAALEAGTRTIDELLDDVWRDAPAILRPAATVTLAAHLDKLEEEGRLPAGVERPSGLEWLRGV